MPAQPAAPPPAKQPKISTPRPTFKTGIPESDRQGPELTGPMATDDDMSSLADEINRDPNEGKAPPVEDQTPPPVEKIDATRPPEEPPKPEPKKEPTPPKPEEKKPETPKPAEKPVEVDEVDKIANDPKTPKKLREAYHNARSESKRLSAEIEALKSKTTESKGDTEAVKTLTDRLEAIQKRADEAEAKLAFADYSQSAEFQNGYRKPYEAAVSEAWTGMKELQKADGERLGEAEIQQLLTAGEREAYRLVDKIFDPADARLATRYIQDVYSLNRVMNKKLDEQRGRAEELRKQGASERTEREARFRSVFEAASKQVIESAPDIYDLETTDPERSKLISEGYRYVDAAFTPPKHLSVDQVAQLRADIRHRAGILPDMKHRLDKAMARIAEQEEELAKFRKSRPGKGEVKTAEDSDDAEEGSMEGAFRTLETITKT